MIDKNGPPPSGTGIKQLRENIAESKLSYEIMDDAAQVMLGIFISFFYLEFLVLLESIFLQNLLSILAR